MAQNFLSDIKLGDNIYIRLGDATNGDLQIFHNASNSIIRNDAGDLRFIQYVDDGKIRFYNDNGSGGITEYFRVDGSAEETLFSKQIRVPDDVKIAVGGSSDLQIYHDGSNSFIRDVGTGNLYIDATSSIIFRDYGSGEEMAKFINDGAIELYYDNSKKFETTNTGVSVTGAMTASGEVTAFSDERLKSNIETLDGSKVYDMRGVSFTKDNKDGSGVIAQELEKVAPELVNNDSEYKSVAYGNITGYLIEAIKDLKAEIEELKKCECKNCNCK